MAPSSVPESFKGLYFTSPDATPEVKSLPTPTIDAGSVLVKPLYSWIPGYANEIYINGNSRQYPTPFPLVGGTNAVGRVVAVGPDATKLKVGDLVNVDPTIRPRDDPTGIMLLAFLAPGPDMTALAKDNWHHGTWAELVKAPLESIHRFDEAALQKQGVTAKDLVFFGQMAIPYGGLRECNVTAGETVLISPATGNFGGAAVHCALAMGAHVIAMGRNETVLGELERLAPGRIDTVKLSGNLETDLGNLAKFGPIDVFLDMTPQTATNTDHITAGMLSLRANGRMAMMSGIPNITVPAVPLLQARNITIRVTMMCTFNQEEDLIKLVQTGVLKIGEKAGMKVQGTFKLEDFSKAMEMAGKESSAGRCVVFTPNEE